MKRVVLLIIIALFCSSAVAQNGGGFSFGAKTGLNISDFTGSTGNARFGYYGGVFADYTISRLGFELGVYYSEQGSFEVTEQSVVGNKIDYRFDYINTQMLAKYQLFSGFRVFAGPEVSYLINATGTNHQGDRYDLNNINYWDVGIVAGVGYSFRFGLDLSASYSRGFFDVFDTSRTAYTSTFRVIVGWSF